MQRIRRIYPGRHKRNRAKLVVFLIFLLAGLGAVSFLGKRGSSQLVAPGMFSSANSVQQIQSPLGGVVQNVLIDAKGSYAVVVKNLKTGEVYSINEHKVFEVGSLYKLWIMAAAYKQIQDGQLTENQVLSEDIDTLNKKFNIDPDEAELKKGTITITVRSALSQMITISHNYAALLLTDKLKLSSVAAFLKNQGFKESTVGTNGSAPTSTPADIALFFEKLYKGELANPQYTAEMVSFLKGQQLNDGLPKYLPAAIAHEQGSEQQSPTVAHKTGDIGWYKHDAGIIYSEKGDYILVVMSESDFPAGAQERIALLSKAVYGYFQGQ